MATAVDSIYSYILNSYGYNEPVLLEELKEELGNINENTLRQSLSRMVSYGEIKRYMDGIYFIPDPNAILKKSTISVNKVINKKYLQRKDERIGYVSGLAFANMLGLTTQNPAVIDIVTEKETNAKRIVELKTRRVALRRPRVSDITENNYRLLQALDLINDIEKLNTSPLEEAFDAIRKYVKDIQITTDEFNKCLSNYPIKTKIRVRERNIFDEIIEN